MRHETGANFQSHADHWHCVLLKRRCAPWSVTPPDQQVCQGVRLALCLVKPNRAKCRFMASQPDKWDYTLAGVPSPLTDELESQQLAKQVICCSTPCMRCHCTNYCQLGHLLQNLVVLFAVSLVARCSTSWCYLQSAQSVAAASVGAVCGQPHLCMYLQVAFACPAAYAVVLLAVNCIIACIRW